MLTAWVLSTGHPIEYWAKKLKVSPFTLYRWADGSRSIKAEHVQTLIRLSKGKLTLDSLVEIRRDYLKAAAIIAEQIKAEKEAARLARKAKRK